MKLSTNATANRVLRQRAEIRARRIATILRQFPDLPFRKTRFALTSCSAHLQPTFPTGSLIVIRHHFWSMFFLLASYAITQSVYAADPPVNPFSQNGGDASYTIEDEPKKSKFSFPKPKLPTINLLPKKKPGEPSTLTKINEGTKKFFTGAKDVLMPWSKGSAEKSQHARVTGVSRSYNGSPSMAKRETTSKSFFSLPSLFSSKDKSRDSDYDPPQQVNDFLKQPRVPIE